jgi:signal transduction histidine kinase
MPVISKIISQVGRFLREPTLGRSITLLLGSAIALLLLVNLSTYVLIQRTAAFNDRVDTLQSTRRAARTVLIAMIDAETGQRGYLLTGLPQFLEPYSAAERSVPDNLDALSRAVEGDAELVAAVERVRRLSGEKMREMSRTNSLFRAGQSGLAIDAVRSGRGNVMMDQLRNEIAGLDALESIRLGDATRQSEGSASVTTIVNTVAGVLILILGGMVFVLVSRYFEDLKAARIEIDRINAGLEETVKSRTASLVRANEEIQRFAHIVSHDLRSPLVNVMGYTAELEQAGRTIDLQMTRVETLAPALLEREALTAAREDIPEAVGFIRASTEKMDRLINAILKLSREGRRSPVPEMLDIGAMVTRIADSVRHQMQDSGAEFVVGEIVPLESDRLSMELIMGNLIDNAVKYLEPGRPGRIEVSSRDLAGGWVEYKVTDNGRGIAERDRERVFELFRRAGRQDQPGDGLGLAYVRNSVRRLGGSIELDSVLGEGSTFRLKFPKRLIPDETGDAL